MGNLIFLIFCVAIGIYIFRKFSSSNSDSWQTPQKQEQSKPAKKQSKKTEDLQWLQDRWDLADEHQKTGDTSIFPSWYYDEATDRQLKRLAEEGYNTNQALTKGQASDLIGLNEPPSDGQIEIMKFFKVSLKGMNQTKAEHTINTLLQDKEKADAWANRPPSQLQREEAKFLGIKLPKDTSSPEASKLIAEQWKQLDEDDPKLDEWGAVEQVIDELSDPDLLKEDYEIKKPRIPLIMTALNELKKEGQSFEKSADEIQTVVDKLLELKPDLERA